ncbi:MAG: DUF2489 domain-containing protein [Colwellia sp.]|nr:DUF2489 domain-containing protein [Colwellia sp.]
MLSSSWSYAIITAITIIAVLTWYAFKLLKQVKVQTEKQQQLELQKQQALKVHDKKIIDSIVIIVRAMKEEQCDFAEGCWRLCVLLDSLKLSESLSIHFPAIFELYNAIKHMPILEQRKQLKKQERMKLDFERMKIEAELTNDIKKDLEQLHQYALERISMLIR